ncbi:MAG: DUF370 domain-containing protein [Oscillospiraceae bacterium]|nr:DUF370 domain-containing protein [Oscillospiraceae bacterium]
MYLHIGQNTTIRSDSIIGIFDLDHASSSKITRTFLTGEEGKHHIINVCDDIPRSFIVCKENGQTRIYLTQISSSTLLRRAAVS